MPLLKRLSITLKARNPAPTTKTFCLSGFSKIFLINFIVKPLTDKGFSPISVFVLAIFVISITFFVRKESFFPTILCSEDFLKAVLNCPNISCSPSTCESIPDATLHI